MTEPTAPLTEQQLDEITARADAATPGPWDVKAHVHGASGCRCLSCDEDPAGWTIDHPAALFCEDIVAARSADGTKNQFGRELASCSEGPLLTFEDVSFAARARTDVPALAAEVRRQRTELAAVEMLAPQQCPAGLHADWLVDSEYAHACPWCQIDKLRTNAAAELMPVWEAVYEPGNVSDYLIGYMNDQDAATGAAEAWMRSESEVTGRLEWVSWGDVTPMPDGYDRWFELAQRHDDGVDTGTGITVRRRAATPAEEVAR